MFVRLSVKNLAVVEAVDISFGEGLNVLTGETGAGKSVLMGALHLLLGDRVDRSMIRTGATEATVLGVFSGVESINPLLIEEDIPPCEEGELIIRRSFNEAGAGRIRVNDTPVTAAFLRRLAPFIADIHGPNDQLTLLNEDFQLQLLTSYAQAKDALALYTQRWQELKKLERDLYDLRGDPEKRAEEIDRLAFEVQEIENVAPTEEDGEELVAKHAQAANAEEILSLGNAMVERLTDGEAPLSDQLTEVQRSLHSLAALLPEAASWQEHLATILDELHDLSTQMSQSLSNIEADPNTLAQLDHRMAQIQKLKRKYGADIEAILDHAQKARERLDALREADHTIVELNNRIALAKSKLTQAGEALRAVRAAAIPSLSKAITTELQDLGFSQAAFPILLTPCEPTASGMDSVTFCFEPNPGERARPLAAIASSGEIARVMLAVKSILARHAMTPTLVFDEIDANIGGETGRKVGEKLHRLAEHTQILCITHQPQAAIFGDSHFRVYKQVEDSHTVTHISKLSTDERVDEIARMLGGKDLTSVTLDHAREMLMRVHQEGSTL